MRKLRIVLSLIAVIFLCGCSSSPVSQGDEVLSGEVLASFIKDPASYQGKTVTLVGKIYHVDEPSGYFQMMTDTSNFTGNVIVETKNNNTKYDEYVQVTGIVKKGTSKTSVDGNVVSGPIIEATDIVKCSEPSSCNLKIQKILNANRGNSLENSPQNFNIFLTKPIGLTYNG